MRQGNGILSVLQFGEHYKNINGIKGSKCSDFRYMGD